MSKVFEKLKGMKSLKKKAFKFLAHTYEGKPTQEFLSEDSVRRRKKIAHFVYNCFFALATAFIITQSIQSPPPLFSLRVGDVAEEDIISPITAEIEPTETTQTRREDLARRVPPIFDYDDRIQEHWVERWKEAFKTIRKDYYQNGRPVPMKSAVFLDQVAKRLTAITQQNLKPKDLFFLHENKFSVGQEKAFLRLGDFLIGRIIASSDLFPVHYSTGIIVRQMNQALHETLVQDVSRIWSLDQAREVLGHVPSMVKDAKEPQMRAMVDVVASLIVPNLIYNEALTKKRITAILATVRQPILSLKEGQTVLRKGERITDQHIEVVQNIRDLTSGKANLQRFALTFIILLIFVSVLFRINITGKGFWNIPLKDALFFWLISMATFSVVRFGYPYLRMFVVLLNWNCAVEYFIPVAAGGIIVHLMMGKDAAYTYAFAISIILGYVLDQNYLFSIWSFTVNAAAIQSIRSCKQRTDLFKCGVWSGLLGAILVLTFSLIQVMGFKQIEWMAILSTVVLAFVSGLFASGVTSTVIPFIESVFGYTTSLKLLELSNFNHPLLHALMMKAPGTYHHSVIVGSLAEIAADRVNANGLLARVAAYYHDIGKMGKPLYFIENQSPNENPHDLLQPALSAKILFSHVKNGVRMGREYNLGNLIIDIIEQHHGTTIASYFFNKAKECENREHDAVTEADFRYPGPKPQTREAGIVMLADACEAATRSINDPTAAKIQTMVHNITTKRFLEEQFSECDLTLKDLKVIEDHFTRTLVSLYHHRIEYPGQKKTMDQVAAASNGAAPTSEALVSHLPQHPTANTHQGHHEHKPYSQSNKKPRGKAS